MADYTMSRERSNKLFERARRLLVGGVNSPVRAFNGVGGTPVFVDRAEGPYILDADGNRYVDLVCSWGADIAGHAHPAVVEAVSRAASGGLSFGACCAAEADLAEIIVGAIPSIELVRFVNSGTEATMSVLRLARAATGRTKTIKFAGCYHGHVDSLLVAAGSGAATLGVPDSAGVPSEFAATTLLARYNDLSSVKNLFVEHGPGIAAVIVEPVAGNMGFVAPADGFLEGLRSLCDRHGSLLVFDEVMTGFRVGWGGYQNLCGVRPDLTCLGKVIGGGMPVAAYGGPRALMEQISPVGPVYQAGTLSGNPVAMAAGVTTLTLCREAGFYQRLDQLSNRLVDGLSAAARRHGVPVQVAARGGMLGLFFFDRPVTHLDEARACDHERFAAFFHAMLDPARANREGTGGASAAGPAIHGVWLPPSGYEAMFLSAAHTDADVEYVLSAADGALRSLRS